MSATELQVFDFESNDIRVTVDDQGDPWWIAADVCRVLDIRNSRDALKRLDEDDKGVVNTDTLGGKQELATVNESGLWSLVLTSRKPEAKRFKKWLTSTVIPTLRKTGRFVMTTEPNVPAVDPLIAQIRAMLAIAERQSELARRHDVHDHRLAELERRAATTEVRADAALAVATGDTRHMALVGYCRLNDLKFSEEQMARIGAKLSRECRRAGIEVKKVHSEKWGVVNAYPTEILDEWRALLA